MSLCHATQQQKLQSSPRFGAFKAEFPTCLLLIRRSACFIHTGIHPTRVLLCTPPRVSPCRQSDSFTGRSMSRSTMRSSWAMRLFRKLKSYKADIFVCFSASRAERHCQLLAPVASGSRLGSVPKLPKSKLATRTKTGGCDICGVSRTGRGGRLAVWQPGLPRPPPASSPGLPGLPGVPGVPGVPGCLQGAHALHASEADLMHRCTAGLPRGACATH